MSLPRSLSSLFSLLLPGLQRPELSLVLNTKVVPNVHGPSRRSFQQARAVWWNLLPRNFRWRVTDLWIWWLQFKPSYFPSCLRLRGNQTQQCHSLTLLLWLCLQPMSVMRGNIPATLWQWNEATGFTNTKRGKPANCGVFDELGLKNNEILRCRMKGVNTSS